MQQRERRDRAEELDPRLEQSASDRVPAHEETDGDRDRRSEQEPAEHAAEAREDVLLEDARTPQLRGALDVLRNGRPATAAGAKPSYRGSMLPFVPARSWPLWHVAAAHTHGPLPGGLVEALVGAEAGDLRIIARRGS